MNFTTKIFNYLAERPVQHKAKCKGGVSVELHSSYSEAGGKLLLHEMSLDKLVCGVNHESIQARLLTDMDLSHKGAIIIDQMLEAMNKKIQDPQEGLDSERVLYTSTCNVRECQLC